MNSARGMRMLRGCWAALLLLLASCNDADVRLPTVGADDVIVAFGDSLTYGTGAREDESYPAVLADLIGRRVVRAGVPGEVTTRGLQRLSGELNAHKPKSCCYASAVTICCAG